MRHFLFISLLFLLFTSCKDDVELHNVWVKKNSPDTFYRYNPVGFSIGGKGYIGLGYDQDHTRADWWEYNPHNEQWTRKNDFPGGGRVYAFSATDGLRAFVGLGYYAVFATRESKIYRDIWQYDAAADKWVALPDAPFTSLERFTPLSFAISNQLFVMNWEGLWSLDLASNTWQQKKVPPFVSKGMKKGNAIVLNNEVYAAISTDEQYISSYVTNLWKYSLQTDSWSLIKSNYGSDYGDVNWSFIDGKGYQMTEGYIDPNLSVLSAGSVAFNLISYPDAGNNFSDDYKAVMYAIGSQIYYYSPRSEYWQYIP